MSQPSYQRLTFGRGIISSARFAPDGQTVVFSAAWDARPYELFSARLGSTESRSLGLANGRILSVSSTGEMAVLLGPQSFFGGIGTSRGRRSPAACLVRSWNVSLKPTGVRTAPSLW